MDIFSHWLWGMALTRGKVSWKVSGPMGVLPDLLAFIPATIYRMTNGISRVSVDDNTVTADMPVAWEIYQWTHSFAIVGFLYCCGYYFFKSKGHENPKYMAWMFVLPWFFHILLDIPGHSIEFFPTPFLHPFSDFMIDGVRWSTWWFFFPQVVVLGAVWWYILKNEKSQSIDEMADTAALA
tara:strand:+ start:585 stop:1127 length:543 start_codon:yes stop_codon:yes gene_type:complete